MIGRGTGSAGQPVAQRLQQVLGARHADLDPRLAAQHRLELGAQRGNRLATQLGLEERLEHARRRLGDPRLQLAEARRKALSELLAFFRHPGLAR